MFFKQISVNVFLCLMSFFGFILNRQSLLNTVMCIELLLLSLNLNFIIFSIYLDDMYGQIFSIFILTVAASESAIGLALIIIHHKIRGSISLAQEVLLRH